MSSITYTNNRERAEYLLSLLEAGGYEAFIIGGAVRDILMHVEPHDFDIVTSARPDDVIRILADAGVETPGKVTNACSL